MLGSTNTSCVTTVKRSSSISASLSVANVTVLSTNKTSAFSRQPSTSVPSSQFQSLNVSSASVLSIVVKSLASISNTGNSTFSQRLPFQSSVSSTAQRSSGPKTAVTTNSDLVQASSNLQNLRSLSLSQTHTVQSDHNGSSTLTSRSIQVSFSRTSEQSIRQTLNSPSITLTSQSFSSSQSFSAITSAISPALARTTTTGVVSKSSVLGFYIVLTDGSTTTINATTTITSPPTDFSTISASNALWTGDTTTQSAGTVFPVLYGCKLCGGRHHGLILGGLGGLPGLPKRHGCGGFVSIFRSPFGCGSVFSFPPLWGLPPFVLGPLGNPIPEKAQPDPTDPESEPEEDPEISSEATSPRSIISQDNPSSTTAPQLTTSELISSKTTASITSSSVSSSTRNCAATGTPKPYAVFLVESLSQAGLKNLSSYLQQEVGGPDVIAEIALGPTPGDSMFAARINDCMASKIGAQPSVSDEFISLTLKSEQRQRLTSYYRFKLWSQILRYHGTWTNPPVVLRSGVELPSID